MKKPLTPLQVSNGLRSLEGVKTKFIELRAKELISGGFAQRVVTELNNQMLDWSRRNQLEKAAWERSNPPVLIQNNTGE